MQKGNYYQVEINNETKYFQVISIDVEMDEPKIKWCTREIINIIQLNCDENIVEFKLIPYGKTQKSFIFGYNTRANNARKTIKPFENTEVVLSDKNIDAELNSVVNEKQMKAVKNARKCALNKMLNTLGGSSDMEEVTRCITEEIMKRADIVDKEMMIRKELQHHIKFYNIDHNIKL